MPVFAETLRKDLGAFGLSDDEREGILGMFGEVCEGTNGFPSRKIQTSKAAVPTPLPSRPPVVLRSQTPSVKPDQPSKPTPIIAKHDQPPKSDRQQYQEPPLPASRLIGLDVHGVLSLQDTVSRECLEAELAQIRFTYVIVGGGTAGLVLARRLSDDPENKVLVIEAGPMQADRPEIQVPNMASRMWKTEVDWSYRSVPQEGLHGRRVAWPRGKLVGGCSNFNSCMLTRAPAVDYDAWSRLGNPGWDWPSLLPYHRRSESFHIPTPAFNLPSATAHDPLWAPSVHGHSGPVQASYSPYVSEQMQGLFEALRAEGLKEIDPNAGASGGVGYAPASIDPKAQTRSSAEAAYLKPALDRENLLVICNAQAVRIVFSSKRDADGRVKAKGVEFVDVKAPTKKIVARVADEVILCGGTFNSPQLLELSGIGDAHRLQKVGIEPLIDLPGVGENLQDHPMVAMSFRLKHKYESLDLLESNKQFAAEVKAQYSYHEGPLTQGCPIVAYLPPSAFLSRTELLHGRALNRVTEDQDGERLEIPRAQLKVERGLYEVRGKVEIVALNRFIGGAMREDGRSYIGVVAALQHALSRGSVHITSPNPLLKPRIDPRFLSHASDAFHLSLGARHVHALLTAPHGRMSQFVDLPSGPGAGLLGLELKGDVDIGGDEAWEEWVRANAGTEHHPSSTCSMLPRIDGGVVDPKLLVYGTANVRVADMSIVPLLVGTHARPAKTGQRLMVLYQAAAPAPPAPAAPLPSLPHELLLAVFTLALLHGSSDAGQEHGWTAFPARAQYLAGLCTLSRAWRAWAQRRLWAHVVLADDEAVRAFVAAGEVARRHGWPTETLRLGGTQQGRRMDGARLADVLAALTADTLREVWVVTAKAVDLRVLSALDNLRTLVCVDVQLAPPMSPAAAQAPVPSVPPRLPRLETLVLKNIDFAPSLRTISFEDHDFPALETLYFDSHEVLTQVFDGNPHAMPRLRALSPAHDVPSEYLEALHAPLLEDDEGSSRASSPGRARSDGASDDGDEWLERREPGQLRLLNITADFLRHLAHFAPSLPWGITHLRLDFALDTVSDEDVAPLIDNADFASLFEPCPFAASDPFRRGVLFVSHASPPATSFDVDFARRFPAVAQTWDAASSPCAAPAGPDVAPTAPQDALVPWGFLRAAQRALEFDDRGRGAAAAAAADRGSEWAGAAEAEYARGRDEYATLAEGRRRAAGERAKRVSFSGGTGADWDWGGLDYEHVTLRDVA
ncbi:hypothetical protein JCM3770_002819 [Rhodotorula araucariae]